MKKYTEKDMLRFALHAKDKTLYNESAVKKWAEEDDFHSEAMYGSEYNLVVEGSLEKVIGFGCIADMIACAHILACLPNCSSDFFTVTRHGYLDKISTSPVRRSLNGINWHATEKRLQEYLVAIDAQLWVIERKDALLKMIHSVLKWQSESANIADVLSKENIGKLMTMSK